MKKILYIFSVTVLLALHSCTNQDPYNWYPEAADYTGQFVTCYYVGDEMSSQTLVRGYALNYNRPVYIYNTAANTADEIWLSDERMFIPLKVKMSITGSPTEFYSPSRSFGESNDNQYIGDDINGTVADPTAAGQIHTVQTDVARAAIETAKILPLAATTPGGNTADSIYMKINIFGGTIEYESYQTDQSEWADPQVPEYAWAYKQVLADPSSDHNIILSGFRWTGYDEDMDIYE